jgi:hypothetical protein
MGPRRVYCFFCRAVVFVWVFAQGYALPHRGCR